MPTHIASVLNARPEPRFQKPRDLKGHFALTMPENGLAVLHGKPQLEPPAAGLMVASFPLMTTTL
jgi:hypothetical protein